VRKHVGDAVGLTADEADDVVEADDPVEATVGIDDRQAAHVAAAIVASAVTMSASTASLTTFRVITVSTATSPERPLATTRRAMSRSVTMPMTSPPRTTTTHPTRRSSIIWHTALTDIVGAHMTGGAFISRPARMATSSPIHLGRSTAE
jgi:hypothetical protein